MITNSDCIEGMLALPDSCVDLVLTDPPFGINFNEGSYNRKTVLPGYKEAPPDYYKFSRKWLWQAHRVLKPTGTAFVVSGWSNLEYLLTAARHCGFVVANHIIWKYNFGVFTTRRFVTSHYHILFLAKQDKFNFYRQIEDDKEHYHDVSDVWEIKRESWTGVDCPPTKLPMPLVLKMLKYGSEIGDTVLDPFLGSGQTAVACERMGRECIGFEIVPKFFEFAQGRLT